MPLLHDHQDLPRLVDLDVDARARVARLDRRGAVQLAPVVVVHDVGAGQPVGLLEGDDRVATRRGERRADAGHADLEAVQGRQQPLDAQAGGSGPEGAPLGLDALLDDARAQVLSGRQGERDREPVDATQRDGEDGAAVAAARLDRGDQDTAMDDARDDDAVVDGRRHPGDVPHGQEGDDGAVTEADRRTHRDPDRRADRAVGGARRDVHAALRGDVGAVGAARVRGGRDLVDAAERDHDLLIRGGGRDRAADR